MDKIKIANLLITRNCNLSCSYCRIAGNINYIEKPFFYPGGKYFLENEKESEWWISICDKLYNHNNDIFFIIYGGEPFLKFDCLVDIVNHMNSKNMNYTIISSCNNNIKKLIYEFFKKVDYVKGFTSSVDPGYYLDNQCNLDEFFKSDCGFETLKELKSKGLINDPVAELTVSSENIEYLYETVRRLNEEEITSDITLLDISKNNYYDFSAVTNPELLLQKTQKTIDIFQQLKNSNFKIHLKETLLDDLLEIMPAEIDCKLQEYFHNISIDSDGKIRLCLRIRGRNCSSYDVDCLFDENGNYTKEFYEMYEGMKSDKNVLCKGCNWTCVLMSKNNSNKEILDHE